MPNWLRRLIIRTLRWVDEKSVIQAGCALAMAAALLLAGIAFFALAFGFGTRP